MTLPGTIWPNSPFWTYSLDLYGRSGVKDACLSLQERRGLDVNLVLWAFWLSSLGLVIDRTGMAAAEQRVSSFRTEVVQPLRAVRRQLRSIMKGRPSPIAADWPDEVTRLGDQVAASELDGEHLIQLALERSSARFATGDASGPALAADNLCVIASYDAGDRADLEALFAGAFPGASSSTLARAFRSLSLP